MPVESVTAFEATLIYIYIDIGLTLLFEQIWRLKFKAILTKILSLR